MSKQNKFRLREIRIGDEYPIQSIGYPCYDCGGVYYIYRHRITRKETTGKLCECKARKEKINKL